MQWSWWRKRKKATRGQMATPTDREKRLVRLYVFGEIEDEAIKEGRQRLRSQKALIKRNLRWPKLHDVPTIGNISRNQLAQMCGAIAIWLDNANEKDHTLALEELQVTLEANSKKAKLFGVLPTKPHDFITTGRTSA